MRRCRILPRLTSALGFQLGEVRLLEKARDAVEQMVQRNAEELAAHQGPLLVEDCADLVALKESLCAPTDPDQPPSAGMEERATGRGPAKKSTPSFMSLSHMSQTLDTFVSECTRRRHSAAAPKRSRLYEMEAGASVGPGQPEAADCGLQRGSAAARPSASARRPADDVSRWTNSLFGQ